MIVARQYDSSETVRDSMIVARQYDSSETV